MIYYLRHGESEANERVHDGDVLVLNEYRKYHDARLTELGREQAREVAEKLKDKNIEAIVTSGLERSIEMGEIINGIFAVQVPMIVLDDLNERLDRREVVGWGDEEWHKAFEFGYASAPGIEKLEEFRDRVVRVIEMIKREYGDKNVLVVGHGGVSHIFRRYFSGEPWEGNIRIVRMKNGEIAEFDFDKKEVE